MIDINTVKLSVVRTRQFDSRTVHRIYQDGELYSYECPRHFGAHLLSENALNICGIVNE